MILLTQTLIRVIPDHFSENYVPFDKVRQSKHWPRASIGIHRTAWKMTAWFISLMLPALSAIEGYNYLTSSP